MIATRELLERSGLTPSQLSRIRTLRLIDAPTYRPTPGVKGDRWHYSEEALYRLGVIRQMQDEGLSLAEIAERLRGTTVMPATREPGAGEVEVMAPVNPDLEHTCSRLWAQVEELLGSRELVGLRLVGAREDGKLVLYVAGALVR